MPPLTWTVRESETRTTVLFRGDLTRSSTIDVYTTMLKCLAEQPTALLIDLSEMTDADHTALSVFTAVTRQAALWPGIPVLLCAATPSVTAKLTGVSSYESLEAALRMVGVPPPMVIDQLMPEPGAPRHARNLVTEACLGWGLPELVGPASLIASELVTNAVEHAGTPMTLRISRRDRYVHIALRDGSPVEPAPRRALITESGGRGLLLVSSVAVDWGSMPSRNGKVVWATLAAG
jgi:ABC-type transporter Mla MlaB component